MGADRSTKLLFSEALEHAPEERGAFLDRACAGDPGLRAKIDRLLDAHRVGQEFLARGTEASAPAWSGPALEGPGASIGPYRLLQQIGEGGFGVVFMAEQMAPVLRRVALKIIKAGMDTRQVIARFEVERQALAMMDHPGIARVFDAGATVAGRPYFVMELVRGEPITAYCDAAGMAVRERLELFQQVCHAVQHAHQKGIIHRDLKSSNVLVADIDGRPTPKIIDFGIAKATGGADGAGPRLTEKTIFTDSRQFVGTPEYMSPEQAGMGPLDIDTRSDIYSLGVLLYELLTGGPPFDPQRLHSATWEEMRRIIREDEAQRPSTRLHSQQAAADVAARRRTEPARLIGLVRGDLDWIVMKCLEKDRARRYETASGLATDIGRHLSGEPVLAAPPNTVYRLRKFVRRHRVQVIAGSLVAASMVTAVAGTATFAVREARRARETKQVADFQAKMLSDINVRLMGERLREDLMAEAGTEWARRRLDLEVIDERRAHLESLFADINFTNAAIHSLDRNIFEDALATLQEEFADQPMLKARQLQHFADTMRALSLLDRAMEAQAEAMRIRVEELGKDDPDTLVSIGSMGGLLGQQGKWAEAEPLVREALEGWSRVRGREASETLRSKYLLGYTLQRQGHLEEAEALLREALEAQRRVLGEDHRDVLVTMLRLGQVLIWRSKTDEAAPLLETAVAGMRLDSGDDHTNTLSARTTLARLRYEQNRFAEAEALLRDVLPVMHRELGDRNRDTWFSTMLLGEVLRRQGKLADAEPLLEDCVRALRDLRGDVDADTLAAVRKLGLLRRDQGMLQDAASNLGKALAGYRLLRGEADVDTRVALLDYAHCLVMLRRFGDAERELLRTVSATLEAVPRPVIDALIALYVDWHAAEPGDGYDAKAAEWRAKGVSDAR